MLRLMLNNFSTSNWINLIVLSHNESDSIRPIVVFIVYYDTIIENIYEFNKLHHFVTEIQTDDPIIMELHFLKLKPQPRCVESHDLLHTLPLMCTPPRLTQNSYLYRLNIHKGEWTRHTYETHCVIISDYE